MANVVDHLHSNSLSSLARAVWNSDRKRHADEKNKVDLKSISLSLLGEYSNTARYDKDPAVTEELLSWVESRLMALESWKSSAMNWWIYPLIHKVLVASGLVKDDMSPGDQQFEVLPNDVIAVLDEWGTSIRIHALAYQLKYGALVVTSDNVVTLDSSNLQTWHRMITRETKPRVTPFWLTKYSDAEKVRFAWIPGSGRGLLPDITHLIYASKSASKADCDPKQMLVDWIGLDHLARSLYVDHNKVSKGVENSETFEIAAHYLGADLLSSLGKTQSGDLIRWTAGFQGWHIHKGLITLYVEMGLRVIDHVIHKKAVDVHDELRVLLEQVDPRTPSIPAKWDHDHISDCTAVALDAAATLWGQKLDILTDDDRAIIAALNPLSKVQVFERLSSSYGHPTVFVLPNGDEEERDETDATPNE